MIKDPKRFLKIWILAIFFLVLLGKGLVLAKETKDSADEQGVTLSPPLMELALDPGEAVTEKIKLSNSLGHEVKLYPVVYDFRAKGEKGKQEFIEPSQQGRSFSLASWISYSRSSIFLASEEVDYFNFSINAPANAEPGGHYGVIFFSTASPEAKPQEGQISVTGMVGSLILVKVSGDIRENAQIKEFSTASFFTKGPIDFVTRIENLGNVHFKPKGSISILDFRGKNLKSLIVNETEGNILPESIRRFENSWKSSGSWGRFTAKLSLTYGDTHKTLEDEIVFWIIPTYVMVAIVVVILAIIFFIVLGIRRRKPRAKNNKSIVDINDKRQKR